MKQFDLFGAADEAADHRLVDLEIKAGTKPLTRNQSAFNRWRDRVARQRDTLDKWADFQTRYHARLASQYIPLDNRLRERRMDMVRLLDAAIGQTKTQPRLTRRERASAVDILLSLTRGLLAHSEEPELIALHDRHSPVRFKDEKDQEIEELESLAREIFGDDFEFADDDPPGAAPAGNQTAEPLQKKARTRRKSAKTLAREAEKAQAADNASRSVREIFRKLASQLHPDREQDPVERERKTVLMQQANEAYQQADLLTLLELQLSATRTGPDSIADLPDARLTAYIDVLRDQSRELQRARDQALAPFARILGVTTRAKFTPDDVDAALNADIAQLQVALTSIERDLEAYRDIRRLKADLSVPLELDEDDEFDLDTIFAALAAEVDEQMPKSRKRAAKRRRRSKKR